MATVAHDTRPLPPDSFPELYYDVASNLAAITGIMSVKLPAFIAAVSSPELVSLFGDCLALASRHHSALEAIMSRLDRPVRSHAVALESLLGTTAAELDGWAPGEARDLVLIDVVRAAVYMEIPACELAMSLAARLEYERDAATLTGFREDIAAIDSRLHRAIQTQVSAPRVARATFTTATGDLRSAL